MSNRDTYIASVKSATAAKVATLTANETSRQETVNASGVNVGYTLQSGNNANLLAAVKSANQAKRDADFAAEHARQVAIGIARDTLRTGGGDTAPF
jgi:hypothetical protein